MSKHILITGGAGFIGSHLAKRCLQSGFEVTVIDNLSTGCIENLPKGVRFIEMDISNKKDYEKIFIYKFDAIFHLAAQSSGEISNECPDLDLEVNTLGTLLLLNFCKKQNISRFIYASSMAVYGDVENNPVSEATPCSPLSFYGITKLASEHYIQHYNNEGIDTTCFRMFSVYGPGQNLKNMKQGMVSIFLSYLLGNNEIWVKGSGERYRDFIFIDDVVDAWIIALSCRSTYGKIYNLATGVKTTVKELVEKEVMAFGHDPYKYPVRYEGNTPFDQFGLYADISCFKTDTGWKPTVSLNDGLEKMVGWAKGLIKD